MAKLTDEAQGINITVNADTSGAVKSIEDLAKSMEGLGLSPELAALHVASQVLGHLVAAQKDGADVDHAIEKLSAQINHLADALKS